MDSRIGTTVCFGFCTSCLHNRQVSSMLLKEASCMYVSVYWCAACLIVFFHLLGGISSLSLGPTPTWQGNALKVISNERFPLLKRGVGMITEGHMYTQQFLVYHFNYRTAYRLEMRVSINQYCNKPWLPQNRVRLVWGIAWYVLNQMSSSRASCLVDIQRAVRAHSNTMDVAISVGMLFKKSSWRVALMLSWWKHHQSGEEMDLARHCPASGFGEVRLWDPLNASFLVFDWHGADPLVEAISNHSTVYLQTSWMQFAKPKMNFGFEVAYCIQILWGRPMNCWGLLRLLSKRLMKLGRLALWQALCWKHLCPAFLLWNWENLLISSINAGIWRSYEFYMPPAWKLAHGIRCAKGRFVLSDRQKYHPRFELL